HRHLVRRRHAGGHRAGRPDRGQAVRPRGADHHHHERVTMDQSSVDDQSRAATSEAAPKAATDRRQPRKAGIVTWACNPGFPPSTIFPFTPPERIGIRNLFEFQVLMFRRLYWLGRDGRPEVDDDLSLAEPPEWSDGGRTVTVTLKPWQWSNGEPICADNVLFWVNMMAVKGSRYGSVGAGFFPGNPTPHPKPSPGPRRFPLPPGSS